MPQNTLWVPGERVSDDVSDSDDDEEELLDLQRYQQAELAAGLRSRCLCRPRLSWELHPPGPTHPPHAPPLLTPASES